MPARCGNRHCVPPTEIAGLVEQLVSGLAVVLSRRDLTMSAKAAWAMGRLLAVHPFNDGNGRLGRLLANWVLVSCGFPFAVVLCGSDAQRADYMEVPRAHTHFPTPLCACRARAAHLTRRALQGVAAEDGGRCCY